MASTAADFLQVQYQQYEASGLEYLDVLQNIYNKEVGNSNSDSEHKLLMLSVHAVFLESGFVCFDSVTEKKTQGFLLPFRWDSKPTVTIQYTLCSLLHPGNRVSETIDVKFQPMGKFVYVHGCLSKNNPVGFFRLDASQCLPSINYMRLSNTNSTDMTNRMNQSARSFHEKQLFNLWKTAKDGLASPLLTDLCYKTGLEPPPCFTSLLTDLKLKILEFLPGTDIARVGSVSSELKRLSANDDLWKQKYMEEFSQSGSEDSEKEKGEWKEKYINSREKLKKERRIGPFRFCGGTRTRRGSRIRSNS